MTQRLAVCCITLRAGLGHCTSSIAVAVIAHIGLVTDVTVVIAVAGLIGALFQNVIFVLTVITKMIIIVSRVGMLAHISLSAVTVTLVVLIVIDMTQGLAVCCITLRAGLGHCTSSIAVAVSGHIGLVTDVTVVIAVAGLIGACFQNVIFVLTVITKMIIVVHRVGMDIINSAAASVAIVILIGVTTFAIDIHALFVRRSMVRFIAELSCVCRKFTTADRQACAVIRSDAAVNVSTGNSDLGICVLMGNNAAVDCAAGNIDSTTGYSCQAIAVFSINLTAGHVDYAAVLCISCNEFVISGCFNLAATDIDHSVILSNDGGAGVVHNAATFNIDDCASAGGANSNAGSINRADNAGLDIDHARIIRKRNCICRAVSNQSSTIDIDRSTVGIQNGIRAVDRQVFAQGQHAAGSNGEYIADVCIDRHIFCCLNGNILGDYDFLGQCAILQQRDRCTGFSSGQRIAQAVVIGIAELCLGSVAADTGAGGTIVVGLCSIVNLATNLAVHLVGAVIVVSIQPSAVFQHFVTAIVTKVIIICSGVSVRALIDATAVVTNVVCILVLMTSRINDLLSNNYLTAICTLFTISQSSSRTCCGIASHRLLNMFGAQVFPAIIANIVIISVRVSKCRNNNMCTTQLFSTFLAIDNTVIRACIRTVSTYRILCNRFLLSVCCQRYILHILGLSLSPIHIEGCGIGGPALYGTGCIFLNCA